MDAHDVHTAGGILLGVRQYLAQSFGSGDIYIQIERCPVLIGIIEEQSCSIIMPYTIENAKRPLDCKVIINPEWAEFLPKWCGYIILFICIGLGVLIMIRLPGTTGPVFVALAMVLGRVLENPLAKKAFRGYNKHNYVLRGKRYD